MTIESQGNDTELDVYFQAARVARPVPDMDLTSRILADAAIVGQDHRRATERGQVQTTTASASPGLLSRLSALVGGFGVAVPVMSCLVVGLAIGLNGGVDQVILQGLDIVSGQGDVVALGYAVDGMDYIGTEAGL